MSTATTTSMNIKRKGFACLALSIFLSTSGFAANAQGLEAGQAGSLSQLSSLGADQDSLLPPEVVPLDAQAAAKLSQMQAQSRAASLEATAAAQGGAGTQAATPLEGLHSAQDFRKAALNSLMNQNPWQGQMPNTGIMQNQAFSAQASMPFGQGQPMQGAMGQGSFVAGAPQGPPLGQSAWQGPGAQGSGSTLAQSQTLTGGVKEKRVVRDIKRGGVTNALSALAGFGSGVMVGSMVRNPNTAFGLGMFGLGLTGFGVRNGFRF